MLRIFKLIFILMCTTLSAHAGAALNVLTCEPEWAALIQELAGDEAKVSSATTGMQNPHRIEAKPSLIARARNADLLVCTGADLEIGWLPILLQQSGNAKIQPGKPGYFEASQFVERLEIPNSVDRSQGDVHAAGNPHIQTDPRNILKVADALSKRLEQVDPTHAQQYQARYSSFNERWKSAIARWEKSAAPLKGMPIVVQHREWVYLTNWLGLHEIIAIEPKPGVEPSTAHLNNITSTLKQRPAKFIIRSAYQNGRPSEWLSQNAKIPVAVLPATVGGNEQAKDLFSFYDDTLKRLLEAAK